jgi:hypothetical protein
MESERLSLIGALVAPKRSWNEATLGTLCIGRHFQQQVVARMGFAIIFDGG